MNDHDMLFLIQDYLAGLNERDELDAILPDMLRAMGFQIVKLAFRGEVEHGVDIAAVGQVDNETVLYLIQVKAGDIDAAMWDAGPNAVRPTLNNLLDVPFEDLTQPRLQRARKQAILAHNGHVRENVRARLNSYIDNEFRPRMDFDRWDLDRLTGYFHDYLVNERILPKQYQRLLKRTFVFLDVPDYDLSDLKQLMAKVLPDVKRLSKPQRIRLFGVVRLVLAMIRQQCQNPGFNNLSPSVASYEIALLAIWGWIRRNGFFSNPVLDEFARTYIQYLDTLSSYAQKITSAVNVAHGLAFGGTSEQVEYPLRTFQVIGNLGFLATAIAYMPQSDLAEHQLWQTSELLIKAIQNNRSRHRPLLDNHSIDILLGIWPLILTRNHDFARWWIDDLLEHLAIRKQLYGRLPELYNNLDAVIEYEATGERPIDYVDSSSTLVYMLFELCLLLDASDLYARYRDLFSDVNFQVWYPPENVEETLYWREVFEGDTEIIHSLPECFDEFRLDVEARYKFDRIDYSPIVQRMPMILLLANKYYRTPIFPFWWREMIFGEQNNGHE